MDIINESIDPCKGCPDHCPVCGNCISNGGCGKPQTNGDRIRAMTDRELASFITFQVERKEDTHAGERFNRWFEWLKQECE